MNPGDVFERHTIVAALGPNKYGTRQFLVRCSCGKERAMNITRAKAGAGCSSCTKGTLAERFAAGFIAGGDGCWNWTGTIGKNGYGSLVVSRKRLYAHRVAWETHHGRPVPDGLLVCHTCDNRRCVRPDHLFVGTDADNSADAIAKGRHVFGDRHPAARLTDEIVAQIKTAARDEGLGARRLGRRFGLGQRSITRILSGQSWKHVAAKEPTP
jgi:hypothetical protein